MDDNGYDLASRLPPEIQAALKRKSSRDPNSRFPRKLHMLLTYLATDPQLESEIGLSWISDTEFKMNKKNVAKVMGIKLNTMNVNLRDLGFEQLQHDKGGWTQWKRANFTRTSIGTEPITETNSNNAGVNYMQNGLPQPMSIPPPKPRMNKQKSKAYMPDPCANLRLGQIGPMDEDTFRKNVDEIWQKLSSDPQIQTDIFIRNAADYFKQPEQPLDNAIEVIKAIVDPHGSKPVIDKADLFRFLAMFGPDKTAMLKIASLLLCSNNNGNWLTFENPPEHQMQLIPGTPFTGSFDLNEPNCLVLRYPNAIKRIWNHPTIDAFGTYLFDERGNKFQAWDKVFELQTPMSYQQDPAYL